MRFSAIQVSLSTFQYSTGNHVGYESVGSGPVAEHAFLQDVAADVQPERAQTRGRVR